MTVDRRRVGLAVIVFAVLAFTGFAVADALTHSSTAGVVYETNSGVTVTLGDDRDVAASPFDGDETFADGTLRLTGSDAVAEVDEQTYAGDPVTLRGVDVAGSMTVERADLEREITIENGDAAQVQIQDYQVDNDAADIAYASDGGLTVTFSGVPEGVGIGAIDTGTGEVLDSVTDAPGGEVTFTLAPGTREVELQTVPSELQVRNEANPDELIQEDAELRFRAFFDEDGDGEEQVIEREVTDGTVDLDGLPADQQIVVTVREENADFVFRRILIDNIVQTSEIYLLPTSEPSAEVVFSVEDQTGRFAPDQTRLIVEKPITRDGETDYRIISGDRLSAGGEFPTILEDSERYRLRVENDAGEQRVLGSHVVQGAQREVIPIGDVQFSADVSEGAAMQASLRDAPETAAHNHEARIVYLDPEGETDSITISVTDSDGNEIRPETTETLSGATGAYVETYPLDASFNPDEDTATVTVDAERGLEIETFEQVLGDIPDVFTDVPINPDLLQLIGIGSIVAVIGLLVIVKPALAALVGPGYAGLLSLVGIVPIPMTAVVLAGVVGVLAVVGTNMRIR